MSARLIVDYRPGASSPWSVGRETMRTVDEMLTWLSLHEADDSWTATEAAYTKLEAVTKYR